MDKKQVKSKSNRGYFNFDITSKSKIVVQEDGSLKIFDVPIMAVGIWTSSQGITARFSDEMLQKFAGNWSDNGLWPKHPGDMPREATNILGCIVNQHYDPKGSADGTPAVMGDLILHGRTASSRDAIQVVQIPSEQGGIKAISAETMLDVEYVPSINGYDVTMIQFTGAALVRKGACESCKLPAFGQSGTGGKYMADSAPKGKAAPPSGSTGPGQQDAPPSPGGGVSMDALKSSLDALHAKFDSLVKSMSEADEEAEGEGDSDAEADGDGDADAVKCKAEADGDSEGDAEGDSDADAEGEGDGEGDSDADASKLLKKKKIGFKSEAYDKRIATLKKKNADLERQIAKFNKAPAPVTKASAKAQAEEVESRYLTGQSKDFEIRRRF
jgi:hypothetical protein